MNIRIRIGHIILDAELNDTSTANKIIEILPFQGPFSTWGDEIYFSVPVKAELDENAQDVVEIGDLGYWPSGRAFCIFFGKTPISTAEKIVPASAVNIIGHVKGDVTKLKEVSGEKEVTLEIH